jgi:hypothetical protein
MVDPPMPQRPHRHVEGTVQAPLHPLYVPGEGDTGRGHVAHTQTDWDAHEGAADRCCDVDTQRHARVQTSPYRGVGVNPFGFSTSYSRGRQPVSRRLGNIVRETLTFWRQGAFWDYRSRLRGGQRARSRTISPGSSTRTGRGLLSFIYHFFLPSYRALSAALRPSPGGARGRAWQRPTAWLSQGVCRGLRAAGHGTLMLRWGGTRGGH